MIHRVTWYESQVLGTSGAYLQPSRSGDGGSEDEVAALAGLEPGSPAALLLKVDLQLRDSRNGIAGGSGGSWGRRRGEDPRRWRRRGKDPRRWRRRHCRQAGKRVTCLLCPVAGWAARLCVRVLNKAAWLTEAMVLQSGRQILMVLTAVMAILILRTPPVSTKGPDHCRLPWDGGVNVRQFEHGAYTHAAGASERGRLAWGDWRRRRRGAHWHWWPRNGLVLHSRRGA